MMKPEEAEQIVRDFGGAVASLPDDQPVLSTSALPYSKIRIRYAFYLYIETLVGSGLLEDDHANMMVQTYALLNTRFRDNADEINNAYKKYADDDNAREYLKPYEGLAVGMP